MINNTCSSFAPWCITNGSSYNNKNLRHQLLDDHSVVWQTEADLNLPHYDHIEMSGFLCSSIINYGVNEEQHLNLMRHLTFPCLRNTPNDTHASFNFNFEEMPIILVDGNPLDEKVQSIIIHETLTILTQANGLTIKRELLPTSKSALLEKYTYINNSERELKFLMYLPVILQKTNAEYGNNGNIYETFGGLSDRNGIYTKNKSSELNITLKCEESFEVYAVFGANSAGKPFIINCKEEEVSRRQWIHKIKKISSFGSF
jgi:hypothetical protein